MRKIFLISLLVVLAVVLAACGGSAQTEEEAHATSDISVFVESSPSPAMTGDVEILLTITDKDGTPIEAAEVKVNAEHPSMAGMGMSGLATEQGSGKYSIKANFSDSGDWVLTVSVHKDGVDHEQKLDLQIQ